MRSRLTIAILAINLSVSLGACVNRHPAPQPDRRVLQIPGTSATIEFVKIEGGSFNLDGCESVMPSFWISSHEIAWEHFEPFASTETAVRFAVQDGLVDRKAIELVGLLDLPKHPLAHQWWLYSLFTNTSPTRKHPASNITPHTAVQYCRWLTWLGDEEVRLPTYNEWLFIRSKLIPNNMSKNDNALFLKDKSVCQIGRDKWDRPAMIQSKRCDTLGLYDYFGNVGEWVLERRRNGAIVASLMGGAWNDDGEGCLEIRGEIDHEDWKVGDPERPLNKWYYSSSDHRMGFRLVIAGESDRTWWKDVERNLLGRDRTERFDKGVNNNELRSLSPMVIKALNTVVLKAQWKDVE